MPVSRICDTGCALYSEIAGSFNREIEIVSGTSDRSLCCINLGVTNLAKRICGLIQRRHPAVSARFCQNRPENILLTAETSAAAIRDIGSYRIQSLSTCH